MQASLSQDKAFATFIATTFFTGADLLAKAKQPVFMWNINPRVRGPPDVLRQRLGTVLHCAPATSGRGSQRARTSTKVGLLAYGSAPQSKDCADGFKASFAKYPTAKVVFDDESIGFAQALGPQVTKMKEKGVQFVLTCVDLQESFTLAKEMKKQGLNAVQELPKGYDAELHRQERRRSRGGS